MRSIVVTLAVAACAMLGLPVHAAEREQGACRADVEKFCKGVGPGGGAIMRCLSQHQSELSPSCSSRMAQGRQRMEKFAEACKPDAEKLCKEAKPGGGATLRCLAANKDQLSAACREKIEQAEKRHPCLADIERLCKGVPPGEGRIPRCLKEHEAELGSACKAAVDKAAKRKD